jgi:hypothetical protein
LQWRLHELSIPQRVRVNTRLKRPTRISDAPRRPAGLLEMRIMR